MKKRIKAVVVSRIYIRVVLVILTAVITIFFSSRTERRTSLVQAGTIDEIYLPVVFKNFDSTLETAIFGVQMYGSTNDNNIYHPSLIESGASWLRVSVHWASIEPINVTPDAFNWSIADSNLAAAATEMGGLHIIATIDNAPFWAADDPNGPIHADNLDDFGEFMEAIVERYDGDGLNDAPNSPTVNHWEFYNEPDHQDRWGHDGDLYAQMLAAVYPPIKTANASANVVFGGIAYDWFTDQSGPFVRGFLDDVLASAGGQYWDIMNFHFYPAFKNNWTNVGPGLLEKTSFIRSKLNSYGYNQPIIITESGWHNNDDHNPQSDDETQISYVVELFTQSYAANVKVMIWWLLNDINNYPYDNGLVEIDTTFKPSFFTYQNIVSELSTAHFNRRLSSTETGFSNMEVYQFNDYVYSRDVYIAWLDPIDTTEIKPLKLPFARAIIKDVVSNDTTEVLDSTDGLIDGNVTVSVSRIPIYVEVYH